MDAGKPGEESDRSHIRNFNQKAQQERGTRSMLLPSALRAKLQEKNKNNSHHQKSPPSVETDTAITWEASLQSAHLAHCKSCGCAVCVHACNHACVLHTGDGGCYTAS